MKDDGFLIGKGIYNKAYYGDGIDALMGRTRSGWQLRSFLRERGEGVP